MTFYFSKSLILQTLNNTELNNTIHNNGTYLLISRPLKIDDITKMV